MAVVTRFLLLLCVAFLAVPATAAAQPGRAWGPAHLDAGVAGNDRTAFAPGDTIQITAPPNNSYSGTLLPSELTPVNNF